MQWIKQCNAGGKFGEKGKEKKKSQRRREGKGEKKKKRKKEKKGDKTKYAVYSVAESEHGAIVGSIEK